MTGRTLCWIRHLTCVLHDGDKTIRKVDPSIAVGGSRHCHLPTIVKLSGDTLTICAGQKGRPHPKEFKSTKEDLTILQEFKRVKKDK